MPRNKELWVQSNLRIESMLPISALMLAQAIALAAYSRYGQLTAGLSTAQIQPHNSQVFAPAESGNVTGLKYVFAHGLAPPFNIFAETGDHPLHITARHGFAEASRLLLSYGTDPHAYDTDHKK
ncbi:hypothetical protein FGG08_003911 [Glutinoglossum americanum]|uniref:Uncharacterized protein n=1 Tax=Glutinoglossum americanum TaxID=1670608 RepID=A0A9P8IA60_9PEZI|nr:hypothetical protein FGG08_003911 [Glutinoglossum americanum]